MGILQTMARKPKSAAAAVTSPIVETELAVQRLRDLDRALVERQIALESDGVSVNAPPTGARHAQARALLDDLPPPPIVPDERDPTNELRAIVEQRATIAVAIRMAGERWATQEQERQIEPIAERLSGMSLSAKARSAR
jgi:hypothetical protein